jgi:hypothetical protein
MMNMVVYEMVLKVDTSTVSKEHEMKETSTSNRHGSRVWKLVITRESSRVESGFDNSKLELDIYRVLSSSRVRVELGSDSAGLDRLELKS